MATDAKKIEPKKIIAYYRVSTQKQGASGLGLEAQQECVRAYAKRVGLPVVRAYQEIESGSKDDRPELAKAISDANRSNALIVVGKLDRLARDAHLISGLQKAGVPFVACDMPDADSTMIGVYAYFGQRERELISQRTKAAMAAYKARGGLLGASLPQCRNLTDEARKKGARIAGQSHRERATKAYADLASEIIKMRRPDADGKVMTFQAIADALNAENHTTRTGKPWNRVQVMRVFDRNEK